MAVGATDTSSIAGLPGHPIEGVTIELDDVGVAVPGLLPLLFSLAALLLPGGEAKLISQPLAGHEARPSHERWLRRLDILIIFTFAISILAIGFDGTEAFGKLFFRHIRSERVLTLLSVSVIARLCLSYPAFLRPVNANLIETLRSTRRGDAFWLGSLLTAIGFVYSLGWNFFFYRICYALFPAFRSMRVPTRGAMFAYLGLALLSGLGVECLGTIFHSRTPRLRPSAVVLIACVALLIELNAAPLGLMRGEVYPDAVTLKLKQTTMRGGVVLLPVGGDFNYRYMLRSTEHQKPLIVGTSGFNSPIEDKIEGLTRAGALPIDLLDLLESVPASYLVIENQSIVPERTADYEEFLARGLVSGRLRFINRFDGHSDLYAVVKTEPAARGEAALPFHASIRDWASKIHEDPVNLLVGSGKGSQLLRWHHRASFGGHRAVDHGQPGAAREAAARGLRNGDAVTLRPIAGTRPRNLDTVSLPILAGVIAIMLEMILSQVRLTLELVRGLMTLVVFFSRQQED
jgi:hypothetical protein